MSNCPRRSSFCSSLPLAPPPQLPPYTSSIKYDDERMPGPVSPPGYVEYVKWACDGVHAIVSMCDRVMLVNLETEKVVYSFETVKKNGVGEDSSTLETTLTPLGPVVHADPHPTDPLKALLSFFPPRTGISNKYYTVSPSSLTAHSSPDPHKLVCAAVAIYRHEPTNPDAIVLLSVYTSIDPDSSVNSMNPLQLKGKDFARISFLPSPGASTTMNPTDILQPQSKRSLEKGGVQKRTARLFLNESKRMIMTTGVGTGIRVYSADDLVLIGVFGEGIKIEGSLPLEYNDCFFCKAYGKIWAAGLPLWWREQGDLFQKMYLWQVGVDDDSKIIEETKTEGFKYKFTTFSERSFDLPDKCGLLHATFDDKSQTILSIGLEGQFWLRSGKISSEWPGPMYPPGYKIVDQNYYYLEQEDELDKVVNEEAEKPTTTRKFSTNRLLASTREEEDVDIFGPFDSADAKNVESKITLKFEKEIQMKLKLEDLKRAKGGENKNGAFVKSDNPSLGGGPNWFLDLLPTPSLSKADEKKVTSQPPRNLASTGNEMKKLITAQRNVAATGSGSSFQVAGDALVTCRACLGRLWAHSCGKERGLPVNMQQQRNLRDKKRQTGIDGRAKLKTKKLLDVKVGGVSGNEGNGSKAGGPEVRVGGKPKEKGAMTAEGGIDGRAKLKTKKLLDVKVGGVSGNEGNGSKAGGPEVRVGGKPKEKGAMTAEGKSLDEATVSKLKKARENAAKKKGTLGALKPAARIGVRVKCSEVGDDYFGVALVPVKKKGTIGMEVQWYFENGETRISSHSCKDLILCDPDKYPVKNVGAPGSNGDEEGVLGDKSATSSHHSMFFVNTNANLPLNCTIKPLAEEPDVVIIGVMGDNCPLANNRKIKEGTQVCYINGVKIVNTAQVAEIKHNAQANQDKNNTIVWTFSNWRLGKEGRKEKKKEDVVDMNVEVSKKEDVVDMNVEVSKEEDVVDMNVEVSKKEEGEGGNNVGNGDSKSPIVKEEPNSQKRKDVSEIASPHVHWAEGTAEEDGDSIARLHKRARILSDQQIAAAQGSSK